MYPGTAKEEPNTQKIKAWPEGYKDESELRQRQIRKSASVDQAEAEEREERKRRQRVVVLGVMERAEFYGFFIGGSLLWYLLVKTILDWHRFPYHTYIVEVCFIVIVPIIILGFILTFMDRRFPAR